MLSLASTATQRWMTTVFIALLILGPILALATVSLFGREANGAVLNTQILFCILTVQVEVWGWRTIKRILWVAVVCRLLAAAFTALLLAFPLGPHSLIDAHTIEALRNVYFTSIGSTIIGLYVSAVIISRMKVWFERSWMWFRLGFAQVVGMATLIALYTVIYGTTVVFLPPSVPLAISQRTILSIGFTIALLPVCVAVAEIAKRAEGRDTLDVCASYSPLTLD